MGKNTTPVAKPRTRILAALGAVLLGAFLGVIPLAGVSTASAATAFAQCNGIDDTPGLEVACSATVTNHLDRATGVTSSTIVARVCRGAAGTTGSGACTTRTITSRQIVASVTQCDAAGNGGGGNVICSVVIVNDVVGNADLAGVTVNECIGSGTGGGANPLSCSPVQSTTGATVTQCNGSVNGGGAAGRVRCTVSGAATAITVRVNQCNGSVNGGGSTAKCAVSFTNHVTPAPTSGSGGSGGSGGSSGSGGSGGSGGSSGSGSPSTGSGGTGSGGSTFSGATAGTPLAAAPQANGVGNGLAYTGVELAGLLGTALISMILGLVLVGYVLWRRRGLTR